MLLPYIERQDSLQPVESHAVPPEVQAAFDKYQVQYYVFLGQQAEVAIENFDSLQPVESHAVPPEVQAAFDKYQVQYYVFLGQQAEVAIENFRWQQRASEVLMWTVLAVVFCGLAFSGYQLYHATRLGKDTGANEIEIGADKVRITSSIVGLAVLFMSIAFLYLFLIEVYRIKPVNMLQQPPAAAQQDGSGAAR